MVWEVVIGMETHAQLATRSKIFSGSSTAFGAEPNRQASAVDLALPGVLPVLNREAVSCAIKFGLAVSAIIVGTLWLCFLADYSTTRDVYFTVATLHVLAEVPFLLRLL